MYVVSYNVDVSAAFAHCTSSHTGSRYVTACQLHVQGVNKSSANENSCLSLVFCSSTNDCRASSIPSQVTIQDRTTDPASTNHHPHTRLTNGQYWFRLIPAFLAPLPHPGRPGGRFISITDCPTGRRTILPCYLSIAEWSDPGRKSESRRRFCPWFSAPKYLYS